MKDKRAGFIYFGMPIIRFILSQAVDKKSTKIIVYLKAIKIQLIYQLMYRIASYKNTVSVPNQNFQTRQLDLFVLKVRVI